MKNIPWEIMVHIMEYADVGTVRRMICSSTFLYRIHKIRHAWLIPYIQRQMIRLRPFVFDLSTTICKERIICCLFMAYFLQIQKLQQEGYVLRDWNSLIPVLRFLYFIQKEIGHESKQFKNSFYAETEELTPFESTDYIYQWTREMKLPRAFFLVKKKNMK
uniref:F-box domain-containing protein n=1 Tax=viral metagenome TaxID=1070528 RepID=A0A6C0D0V9_9ZZZZ